MKKLIISIFTLCMGMLGMQAQTLQFNSNKKFKIQFQQEIQDCPVYRCTLGTRKSGLGRSCRTYERNTGYRKA